MTGHRAAYTANTSTAATGMPTAKCRSFPDLHYPIGSGQQRTDQTAAAKAVCRRCPLTAACLAYALDALDARERHGIWGGLDEEERAQLLAGRDLPAPKPPLIDRIRDLAGRGLSDPEIAARLDAGIGWKRVQTLRLAKRIPAGRNPQPFRARGAA